jgi:hypothetical protein
VRLVIVGLVLLVAACGAGPLGGIDSTDTSPIDVSTSTSIRASASSPFAAPGDGARVRVMGFLDSDERGLVEICPFGADCPGIVVEGTVTAGAGSFVELLGTYDGRSIAVEQWQVVDSPLDVPDYANPCGLEGGGSGNPPDDATEALNRVADRHSDRFAGMWWDAENRVMTVWFTGTDLEQIEAEVDSEVSMSVCVHGGAGHSEAELREIQSALLELVDPELLAVGSFSTDVVRNRVEMSSELYDAPTRQAVTGAFGDAVVVHAFIEVLDGPVGLLPDPIPAVQGDLELLTQQHRGGGGMAALGRFELRYDPDLDCLYFPGDEESNGGEPGTGGRTLPVWPFGYTATSDPVTVYDYDGVVRATEGDLIESGGGFVSVEFIDASESCGATGAWIMSSPPMVVDPG